MENKNIVLSKSYLTIGFVLENTYNLICNTFCNSRKQLIRNVPDSLPDAMRKLLTQIMMSISDLGCTNGLVLKNTCELIIYTFKIISGNNQEPFPTSGTFLTPWR